MRVALIDTVDKEFRDAGPNVAIVSLAACLVEKGHVVGVLDLYFSSAEEQQRFLVQKWDLVGITATSFAFNVARHAAKVIKELTPQPPPVVLGGAHVSVARELVLNEAVFDFGIYGEGELPLLALVEQLEKGGPRHKESLESIPGLIFRSGDRVVVNPTPPRIRDLDSMALPPYELFPMDSYSVHTLSTSRGCPYACVYCASDAILGKKWIAKSPQRIVQEIEHVMAHWGKKPFFIVDDSFNLDTDRVKEFCRLLKSRKLNIRWTMCGGIRADRIDPDMLSLMKETGCHEIGIGVESANPHVLKNIGKGETIEQIRAGIRMIKKAGLPVSASFMIGNPGDSLATIQESIEFIKAERPDSARFFIAIPYPNTKLWQYVEENGTFLRTDYVNYHDHSEEPSFETADFSYADRIKAFRLAEEALAGMRRGFSPQKLLNLIRTFFRYVRTDGMRAALGKTGSYFRKSPVVAITENYPHFAVAANRFKKIETRYSRQG